MPQPGPAAENDNAHDIDDRDANIEPTEGGRGSVCLREDGNFERRGKSVHPEFATDRDNRSLMIEWPVRLTGTEIGAFESGGPKRRPGARTEHVALFDVVHVDRDAQLRR